MKCPSCQADNRANRRFCAACAAPLPVVCPACGFANEPDDRFCGGCAVALPAPVPGGAPAVRPAPVTRQGERRLVTVLFADLAGYTRLTSQLDPEETQAILRRFFDTVDGSVLAFGGTIDKHIGDNVMGIFGAPIAHDNDPERAVRAAVDIHRRVDELSAELPVALRVHIGIASGEVVASELGSVHHQEYTVTGDAVNLAARLQDKAIAGETMVSDAVRRATQSVAVFEDVGELPIKGLADPVRTWKVVSLREERAAPRERGFVGRRSELRQLESILAETLDGGRGAVIQVRGEAGIGKTRLVAELGDHAATLGYACHTALVLDFGAGRGHGAARSIADKLIGLASGAGETERLAACAAAERGPFDPALGGDDRLFLRDLLGVPMAAEEHALYQAMSAELREGGLLRVLGRLLTIATEERPTLLVVEDIHWADRQLLQRLAALAAATADCRAVLLLTSRIDGDPLDRDWRDHAYAGTLTTVDLRPLRDEEAQALAAEVYEVDADLVARCIERAGGNPLFLEQLLENARESLQGGLPATIQSLVLSRMDRLPAVDKRALQAAAVLGQRFAVDAVRALAGAPAWTCEQLIAAYLVRAVEDGHLFHHALIRDGVYSSLTRGHRGELHRAAAAWFATRDPVLHAQHLDLAEDAEAAPAFATAARSELAAHRIERALELAARGRALARTGGQRHELAYLEGELLRDVGRGADAVRAYEDALAIAGDDDQRLRCGIGIAAAHRLFAPAARAFAVLDEVQPIAERAGRDADLAALHYQRGSLLFSAGKHAEATREHEQALAVARRIGSRELEARALSGLADSAYAAGDYPAAREHFGRCLALAEGLGLERFAIMNRIMYLQIVGMLDGWRNAIAEFTALRDRARRIGHRYGEMFAEQSLGFSFMNAGELETAVAHFEQANRMSEALGSHRYTTYGKFSTAALYCMLGDSEQARRNAVGALELARSNDLPIDAHMCELLVGFLGDDPAQRRAALADARRLMVGRSSMDRLNFWQLVLSLLCLAGDWNEVEAAADEIEQSVPCAWTDLWARLARVLAAYGHGRRDDDLRAQARAVRRRAIELGMIPVMLSRVQGFEAFAAEVG